MLKFIKKQSKKIGAPPGDLQFVGEQKVEKVRIRLIDYSEAEISEIEFEDIEDVFKYRDTESVSWINIDGVHNAGVIEKIGKEFCVHPLVLEDIMNTGQRPKIEEHEGYVFFIFKMFYFHEGTIELNSEQISMIAGPRYVVTFQERVGDIFNPIRERIRRPASRFRKSGPGYFAYAIIDTIVDYYAHTIEKMGENIEKLEDELLDNFDSAKMQEIKDLKRELLYLRRFIRPLKDSIATIDTDEYELIPESTIIFFNNVRNHLDHVLDTIESYREMLTGMLDIYMSSMSNRMNEIMKVLTLVAAIFIPLTFIAGIYGMNFEFIPELKWKWGYPAIWVIFIFISSGMLYYFFKRKWL